MPSRSKRISAAVLFGVGIFLLAIPASALETSNSEYVIIREGDVVGEDLYAAAIRVIVDGTLDGDLVAIAAEQVVVNGTVTGSITVVSPSVMVNGEVDGSIRVTGRRLEVEGRVDGDLVGGVVTARLGEHSDIGGDAVIWAWTLTAAGSIGEDLTGTQRRLVLGGSVGNDVDVSVTHLEIGDELSVGGDLGYRSSNDAEGIERASVGGAIVAKEPLPPNIRIRALTLMARLMIVLFLSISALTTAYGWPDRTTRAVARVGRRPLLRWLIGAPIVFAPFLAIALAALLVRLAPTTAVLPFLAVMIPLILALFGVSFALALVAGVPVVGWLGGVLFERLDLYGAILAGSLLIGLVWYLPWLGWLVPIVVLPLGLGAWAATGGHDDPAVSVP